MASLRGIVISFVVILFCSDQACADKEDGTWISGPGLSVPEEEHLCGKVMSGHFGAIQLVDINHELILEPTYQLLLVSALHENPHSMTLNDTYYEVSDRMGLVRRWFQNDSQVNEPITRLYAFEFGEKLFHTTVSLGYHWAIRMAVKKVKLIFMVFTDRALYTLDVWPAYWIEHKPTELLSKVPITEDEPEFALLYKFEKDIASGYIIHKDTWTDTDNYIIYDLWYSTKCKPSSIWTAFAYFLKPIKMFQKDCPKLQLKSDELPKVFYFIEKTDSPHEILLVHRDHHRAMANGSTAERQLFRGPLPNGFQYNGAQYLFDSSLGCVYVILDFEFSLTEQFKAGKLDIRLTRYNIPYEQYFKCPAKYKLAPDFAKRYRANRCDSVIGDDDDGHGHDRGDAEPIGQGKSAGSFWLGIGLACLLFFAAALVVVVVAMVVFRKKTNKNPTRKEKRPAGSNHLASDNKSSKTRTTSGTTTAVVSSRKSKKSSSTSSYSSAPSLKTS